MVFILLAAFFSCSRENIDELVVDQTRHYQPVKTTISGRVLSEQGLPLPNAVITTGSLKRYTDANGMFLFSEIISNSNGQGVMVKKEDFAPFIMRFHPGESNVHFSEGRLAQLDIRHEFSSYNDNTIFSNHIADLRVNAESFVDAFDREYSGEVGVKARLFDGKDRTVFSNGTMAARGEDNELINLLPVASIYFELSSDKGSPIKLRDPANLYIKNLPVKDLSLWHFSEITMEWEKVSELEAMDQVRIAQPGYYTLAQPCHIKTVRVRVTDGDQGMGFSKVKLSINNRDFYTWTDRWGDLNIHVPSYIPYTIEILDPLGNVIIDKECDPSEDEVAVDIAGKGSTILLKGNTIDCERNSVGECYLSISERSWIPVNADATFDLGFLACGRSGYQITAFDIVRGRKSLTYSFLPGHSNLDLPGLMVCDDKDGQYIRYSVNGREYIIDQPGSGFCSSQDSIYIHGDHPAFQNPYGNWDFDLSIDNTIPGDHIVYESAIYTPGQYGAQLKCETGCNISVDLSSSSPRIGEYFTGHFEGTMKDMKTGQDVEISGEFKVIRTY